MWPEIWKCASKHNKDEMIARSAIEKPIEDSYSIALGANLAQFKIRHAAGGDSRANNGTDKAGGDSRTETAPLPSAMPVLTCGPHKAHREK